MKKRKLIILILIVHGCSNPEKTSKINLAENIEVNPEVIIENTCILFSILDSYYLNKYTNVPDTVEIDTVRKYGISGFELTGAKYIINNYYTSSPYYDKVKIRLLLYETEEFASKAFNEMLNLINENNDQNSSLVNIWVKSGAFYIQFENIILERLSRCNENENLRFQEENEIFKDINKAFNSVNQYAIRIPCGREPIKITV